MQRFGELSACRSGCVACMHDLIFPVDLNGVMVDDGDGDTVDGSKSFGSVSCSICFEIVADNDDRSLETPFFFNVPFGKVMLPISLN